LNFELSAQQAEWVRRARELAVEFKQDARRVDESGDYPSANMQKLRDGGFLKLAVPEEFGGLGTRAGWCSWLPHLVLEEIAAGCSNTGWALLTHFHNCGVISGIASDRQCARFFADVVENGALIGSLGSEVSPQQMRAGANVGRRITFEAGLEPVEGGFRANAVKGFCSGGPVSDYLIYWALAPGTSSNAEGLVICVVPRTSAGLSFLPGWEEAIGLRATHSGGAKLEGVFIPWENVLGEPGDWVQKHHYTFELTYAVQLVGTAQGAYDFVLDLIRERPYLQQDDTVMYAIGAMSSQLQSARTTWWLAQAMWTAERYDDAAHASMRALHVAKASAVDIVNSAFDVCGVRSVFKFNPIDRSWRDARTVTLHTRESQLMRLLAEGEVSGARFTKEKYGRRLDEFERKTWADVGLSRDAALTSDAP
jgi:alkylation response protein AidB-like acyl-CoA dehydrogenase